MKPNSISFIETLRTQREAVFECLYEEAFPKVARLVQRRGGQEADARDVFHDALILFYERALAGNLELQSHPAAYVTGIARHLWYRRCRQESPYVGLEQVIAEELPAETGEPTVSPNVLQYLKSAGRRCLDLLQAFYYQRLNMREIAEEFGYSSERSATVQKYKCLEKVRSQVKSDYYEEVSS